METGEKSPEKDKQPLMLTREVNSGKIAAAEIFSVVNGWRFVPEDLELRKQVIYALTVGFDCLGIWVYKQIVPFITLYGIDEFETSILPRLLKNRAETRHNLQDVRQEIEQAVISTATAVYQDSISVFLGPTTAAAISQLVSTPVNMSYKHRRTLIVLLQLVLADIDEADTKIVEIALFLAHVLDSRIFDYLVTHFYKEKDFLVELLLVRMKYAKSGLPPQKHMTDKEIDTLFGEMDQKTYSSTDIEKQARDLLLELSSEPEVSFLNFCLTRCLAYLECKWDAAIEQLIITAAANENKAVRMQAAVILQDVHSSGAGQALLRLVEDPDDEVKAQAIASIAGSIGEGGVETGEAIDRVSVEIKPGIKRGTVEWLANVLVAAVRSDHKRTEEIYSVYCREITEGPREVRRVLVRSLPRVFKEFITEASIIEQNLKRLHIQRNPASQLSSTPMSASMADISGIDSQSLKSNSSLLIEDIEVTDKAPSPTMATSTSTTASSSNTTNLSNQDFDFQSKSAGLGSGDSSPTPPKSALVFPSPVLSTEAAGTRWSSGNACTDLEEILELLMGKADIRREFLKILPQAGQLVRAACLERVVKHLFLINPGMEWRYWTELLECVERLRKTMSGQARDEVVLGILPLKKHWAHVVRSAAVKTEAIFLDKDRFCI
ncbi:hypothetical protein NEHOM01_1778 [Nematocida homosporus]|uniref:uncharacterized protein n=1 Tax=Nematocida homosporus TaxID=1912981 RepID=UPI00221F249F|nr:uncharacterized protein NEHOM01_1778 [Nematocida homosporus]KAI5186889.1 hypothetical protein NEHOM01_1778 [Nematocida homosporus]